MTLTRKKQWRNLPAAQQRQVLREIRTGRRLIWTSAYDVGEARRAAVEVLKSAAKKGRRK